MWDFIIIDICNTEASIRVHKTLYGLHVPHTAFPNATKATTKETTKPITNEVHVTMIGA